MEGQQHYTIGKYDVFFVPWYSEYMAEDFIAVYVMEGEHEIMHSGMTKCKPSKEQAEQIVQLVKDLESIELKDLESIE